MIGVVQSEPAHLPHSVPWVFSIVQASKQRLQTDITCRSERTGAKAESGFHVCTSITGHQVSGVHIAFGVVHPLTKDTEAFVRAKQIRAKAQHA